MKTIKPMNWIFGPELIWYLLYLLAIWLAKLNAAAPHSLDKFLENLHLWVPLAILLTFTLWYVPAVEKNWLLVRVWIACLVGGHHVLDKGLQGHSEQGPGIGTVYIVGWGMMFFALVIGTIFVKIKF
jgi:hypothetical protein